MARSKPQLALLTHRVCLFIVQTSCANIFSTMSTVEIPNFWLASTTLPFHTPRPTAVILTDVVHLFASPNSSNPVHAASMHTLSVPVMAEWITEAFYMVLLASIPLAFIAAYRQKKTVLANKREESLRSAMLANLWLTPNWMALVGLCDLYILGVLPTGPWKTGAHKSLRAWSEKRYLRRLLHMGVVPLAIQDGGMGTRRENGLQVMEEWPYIKLPKYVRSKRRAYFEFLVPMAEGYDRPEYSWMDRRNDPFRNFVQSLLSNHHGYIVTVTSVRRDLLFHDTYMVRQNQPVREQGVTSWSRWLLWFKTSRTLQPAKDPDTLLISSLVKPGVSPLLDTRGTPLVRIEVGNFGKRRLDEWIYGMAQEAGLDRVWNEGELHAHTSEWIQQNQLELPEYLIPMKDRV